METARQTAIAAWKFFEKSGEIGYPILLCSLIALTIIIERVWTYWRVGGSGDWFDRFLTLVAEGNFEAAEASLAKVAHPSSRVLLPLLEKVDPNGPFRRRTLEKLAGHYGTLEVRGLERYLSTLATIGNISPLLGLAGTVLGMIRAFMKIEALQGKVNASVLAGGIWEALLTTLLGLAVAIPVVVAHNYLSSRVNRLAADIQAQAVSFIDAAEEAITGGVCSDDRGGQGED